MHESDEKVRVRGRVQQTGESELELQESEDGSLDLEAQQQHFPQMSDNCFAKVFTHNKIKFISYHQFLFNFFYLLLDLVYFSLYTSFNAVKDSYLPDNND
jgi:hypothetical protein